MDGFGRIYNVRPRSVQEVFNDFKGRRTGLIKALTTDVQTFYKQCDPEKDNLCLYGYPNGTWEVKLPPAEVPPVIPEPPLGINFSRGCNGWINLVAIHSDSWLFSLASYFGGRFHFDKAARDQLFTLINDLPTIAEVVNGVADEPPVAEEDEDMELNEDDIVDYTGPHCAICGLGNRTEDEPWIICRTCDEGYHRECVNRVNHACKPRKARK